jgi:hypothetical protein
VLHGFVGIKQDLMSRIRNAAIFKVDPATMLTAGARETHQQLIGGTVDNENNGQITWETWEVPLLHGKWDGKSDLDEVFRNPAIERVSLSIVACHPLSRFTPTLDACSRVFWAKVPPKPDEPQKGWPPVRRGGLLVQQFRMKAVTPGALATCFTLASLSSGPTGYAPLIFCLI